MKGKAAGIYGDDGWDEVEPGHWENFRLSDDIPSITDVGGEYIVKFNGAESMADDVYTETFGSLEEAVDYAERMLADGRLARRRDFIVGYMAGMRKKAQDFDRRSELLGMMPEFQSWCESGGGIVGPPYSARELGLVESFINFITQ